MGESLQPLTVPEHVHHVDDDLKHVVVMNARNGQIFGLDNSAAVIWKSLAETGSMVLAAEAVAQKYGLDSERAQADVQAFVDQLLESELLVRGAAR